MISAAIIYLGHLFPPLKPAYMFDDRGRRLTSCTIVARSVKLLMEVMSLLPEDVDDAQYWRDFHSAPLSFWEPALTHVAALHGRASSSWKRASLGRNVVFLSTSTVIKFGPPFWAGNMAREAAALRFVEARLPVATPPVVAEGTLDGWEYLLQGRLPGVNLWERWGRLGSEERAGLAYQHGKVMATLHALPADAAPDILQFDWKSMLAAQRSACAAEMTASGVHASLLAQADSYLAAAEPSLADVSKDVLLHGDLTHLNLLVEQQSGRWQLTGLIDWGDVKVGPSAHEFISPGMHMYRGDRQALHRWYDGYGLSVGETMAPLERAVMARAMLYYAEGFGESIARVLGASTCADWDCVAHAFWHLSEKGE